ncbi:MAG: hypothetical protein JO345_19030 [Streptosporangiaceae bacterium]|nr:hypothetical protein [Streptosporangiaceae bacterium]
MTMIEDRLRDYYAARARAIEPEDIRHIVPLPQDSPRRRLKALPRPALLAPLAAAAAVAAVAVTAATLSGTVRPGQSPAAPMTASSLPAGARSVAQLVSAGVIPPHFVTLAANGDPRSVPSYAVVRATATGARLATIQPSAPDGTIVAVTGATDDRTFVLAEEKSPLDSAYSLNLHHGSFYLLKLRSDGTVKTLTHLPITPPDGLNSLALSADGTKLATGFRLADSSGIRVYTLATGAVRTWSDGGGGFVAEGMLGRQDAASVSWAADGRHLLFQWVDTAYVFHERLLDTSLGGSGLLADSRLVLTMPGQSLNCQGDVIITPDGSAAICPGLTGGEGDETVFFREYSTATGKVIGQLGTWTYGHTDQFLLDALWTNPSGSVIIGVIPKASQPQTSPSTGPAPIPDVTPSPPPGSTPRIGVIIGQTFTPLDLTGITNGVW